MTYTGRCVGGPLDGQIQTAHRKSLQRIGPTTWEPSSPPESPRVEIVTYRHWSSKYLPDGLWLAE